MAGQQSSSRSGHFILVEKAPIYPVAKVAGWTTEPVWTWRCWEFGGEGGRDFKIKTEQSDKSQYAKNINTNKTGICTPHVTIWRVRMLAFWPLPDCHTIRLIAVTRFDVDLIIQFVQLATTLHQLSLTTRLTAMLILLLMFYCGTGRERRGLNFRHYWSLSSQSKPSTLFNIHGSVHRESNLIIFQQDVTYSAYYIYVGSSTCFGCWHPSSGAGTAVITAFGID